VKYASGSGRLRQHKCISLKVYSRFPQDSAFGEEAEEVESSGGESSEEERDPLTDIVRTVPNTPIHNTSPGHSNTRLRDVAPLQRMPAFSLFGTQVNERSGEDASVARALSFSSFPTYPSSIWANPWVPPQDNLPTPLAGLPLPSGIYEAATHGTVPLKLEVRGTSVANLASSFMRMLGDAAEEGDFSTILSPDRSFTM
jgi:hypothetical protein